MIEAPEIPRTVPLSTRRQDREESRISLWKRWPGQLVRFGMVGGLNTTLDLLLFNGLLWLFPTTAIPIILMFNSLAYGTGAINSFLLNKYWTFGSRQHTTWREVSRFVVTTMLGVGCNDLLLRWANKLVAPLIEYSPLWVNVAKIVAIAGTVFISYLGMRLWVFTNRSQMRLSNLPSPQIGEKTGLNELLRPLPLRIASSHAADQDLEGVRNSMTNQILQTEDVSEIRPRLSLSIILPAYNEEQVIAGTVSDVVSVVSTWTKDFEVIVVNDGSADQTASIVTAISESDPRVRLVTHAVNQGYGAALVSGFATATKDLTFFMDSDGQFDIRDLCTFFLFIDRYDAVIGYRMERQDSWIRKLNAWGWKLVVRSVLGVQVRDLDCAFKLLHTEFLHAHPLETRGAMVNAELLYRLKMAGCHYKEVGVRHLPRRAGQATGANPAVIMRAFRELFISARSWRKQMSKQVQKVTR